MFPLQAGLDPFTALLGTAVGVAFVGAAVGIAFVVYRDAAARGLGRGARLLVSVGAALFAVPVLVAYAVYAPRLGDRATPATRGERVIGWLSASLLFGIIGGAVLSPPDPTAQLGGAATLFVAFAVIFYVPTFRRGPLVPDE
ncbi:hypothetical protein C461_13536 [Halorubrum aidingense JCM 13560]|uniref:Uncharacterized protein n=1 Tax=Halorubrum aidingense JCM 13560 TaxID=1230454 RepID=M0P6N5_9EURY|nr:hypothetical protein [Halorubrum aidingense]EMA65726.1 hypothetical protein C461_13536 [Halorubrum aidingense JCM 13560]